MSRSRSRSHGPSATLLGRVRDTAKGEDGIGLILVLGYSLVITLLITVSVASVMSTTKSGTAHVQYGQAGDSAEAGVDQVLAKLSKDKTYSSGVPVPTYWADGFPSSSVE